MANPQPTGAGLIGQTGSRPGQTWLPRNDNPGPILFALGIVCVGFAGCFAFCWIVGAL